MNLPNAVKDIIQYEGGFICNFETYDDTSIQIGYLEKSFQFNEEKSRLLNNDLMYVESIWTSGDTLYLIDAKTVKYWNHDKWVVSKRLPIEDVKNYMSSDLNYPIYEDREFVVRSCCRGEFGGAIYFEDKKTNKTYSCQATCLMAVQKIGGSFYVSSTLPHFDGFSTVFKIDDPRKLYEIRDKSQLVDCGWYDIYSENPKDDQIEHPAGYDKGYDVLLDTIGINLVGAFARKKNIYHIYSDDDYTYLGYIKNGKTVAIDTLIEKETWFGNVRDLKHNSTIFPIRNRCFNGLILLKNNQIKIVEFKLNTSS